MKRKLVVVAVAALPLISLANHHSHPMVYVANLDTDAVTHKLFKASNADKAPHPFYKNYCRGKMAHAYPHAAGKAIVYFNPSSNRVRFALAYHGLSGTAIMAHFHIGKDGNGGPIVQTVCGNPPPGNKALGYSAMPATSGKYCPRGRSGFVTGSFRLKGNRHVSQADTVRKFKYALTHGKLYFNVHTCLNEAGEIRGQIVPLRN